MRTNTPTPPVIDQIAVALWAGGMWVTGYLVAPLLFHSAPDRQIAGNLAGTMFPITR